MTTPARNTVAIDPMKLLLTDSAYLKWVEGHNPHTPSGKEIEQFVGRLSVEDKTASAKRATEIEALARVVIEAAK